MKKIVSLVLTLALMCGFVAAFTGCVPEGDGADISVYLGTDVYDFDPTVYYTDSNAEQLMSLLFEPLFTLDKNGNLQNAAAQSYTVDEEKREIVITLRETYWSDEIRVRAEHYIYAWRDVIMDPNNANPAAALFYDIDNAIAVKNGTKSLYEFGAVATDVFEITITYRSGADYKQLLKNLASVATSPVREDITNNNEAIWTKDPSIIATNGAFKLETLDFDYGNFTLMRNPGYHANPTTLERPQTNVVPNTLVSFVTVDGAAREISYSDIEANTVFYMTDAPIADRENAATSVADALSTYSYVFNTEKPLFADAKVRYALSLAIDRAAIVDVIKYGKAASGLITDGVLDTSNGKTFRKDALLSANANVDRALELLSEVDLSSIADKSITLTVNDDEQSVAIAELVKEAWEGLGVGITVSINKVLANKNPMTVNGEVKTIYDSAIQIKALKAAAGEADFDVLAVDIPMYSTDAFVALAAYTSALNGNGANFGPGCDGSLRKHISGWSDSEYDYLINSAFLATDKAERAELLRQAESYLIENAPIAPIIYNQSFAYAHKDISGVEHDYFGNYVFTRMNLNNYSDYQKTEE